MTQRSGWIACVGAGWRAAWRHRWIVVLVWLLFLGAALLAAAPAWRWWSATLSLAPEGDRLLDGLNAALLRELSHSDRSPTYVIAFAPVMTFVLAMLVLNPFVAGGLLGVLSAAPDPAPVDPAPPATTADAVDPVAAAAADDPVRPTAATPTLVGPVATRPANLLSSSVRFFQAGARAYWLFLRLLLLAGVLGVVLAVVFVLPLLPIFHIASENNLERLFLLASALFPASVALAFWLASLLLDVARIRALRLGERRAWRALGGSLRFMWRNLGAMLGVGVAFALLTVLTFAVYFSVSSAMTPKSWLAILLAIVWQQTLSLTRTGLRVSMLAAEVELVVSR